MQTWSGSLKSLFRLRVLSAVVLMTSTCGSAYGTIQVSETFDDDPAPRGWGGVNNRTVPQDYGFSTEDVTGSEVNPPGGTATGGGELGGTLSRQNPAWDGGMDSFYGVDLGGSMDISTDAFFVSGVVHLQESDIASGFYVGYSRGVESYTDGSDILFAKNFIGVLFDDSIDGIPTLFSSTGNHERMRDMPTPSLVEGTTVPFSIGYDPNADDGNGALTVDIKGVTATWNLPGGAKGGLDPLTHFGIMPVSRNGNDSIVWFDDLTYTALNRIPEPSTLVLLAVGLLSMGALRLRRCSP